MGDSIRLTSRMLRLSLLAIIILYCHLTLTSSSKINHKDNRFYYLSSEEVIPCSSYTNCGDCLKANAIDQFASSRSEVCQWCRNTESCFNSTETQSSGTLHKSEAMLENSALNSKSLCKSRCTVKTPAMCPPAGLRCGDRKTCTNCTLNAYCDFCESSGECFNPCEPITPPTPIIPPSSPPMFETPETMQPASFAPDMPESSMNGFGGPLKTCSSCVWSTPEQCKAASFCGTLFTCSLCTSNPDCGWCSDTQTCLPAKNQKPCNTDKECKYWAYGSCEVACNWHSNCSGCLSSNHGCKWCAGGTFNNRTASYCTLSPSAKCKETFSQTCPDCSKVSNCSSCNTKSFCGWCGAKNPKSSVCVEGSKSGPYDPSDCHNDPSNPAVGWITKCQPWNSTTPLPPVSPPTNPPIPIEPPQNPPISIPPTPIPLPPYAEPISESPEAPSPISTPAGPADLLPAFKHQKSLFQKAIIIGGSVGGTAVLLAGLIWYKLHQSSTYRYRAIG